ncbi:MAG: serine hydrolase domain-containing protein [Pirellulaceae bacterium]
MACSSNLKRPISLCFLFLVWLLPSPASAQTHVDDEFTVWAKMTVQERMRQNNIPSASVGVVRDGLVLFTEGFGVRELGRDGQVDGNSLFQIASQSKMFTGIIVNCLIDDGRLNLNAPITKWLGNSLNATAKEEWGKVTLKHLLHHRSGFVTT